MLATTKYGLSGLRSLARFGLLALVPVVALGAIMAHELNVDLQQRYLDTAQIFLLALDLEGRVTQVNRYACSVLGWSADGIFV